VYGIKNNRYKSSSIFRKGQCADGEYGCFFVRETIYINYITDIENNIRKSDRVFENKQKLL
jgi:hypothetical protein